MKLVSLFLALAFVSACGKVGGGSSSSDGKQAQDSCSLDGRAVSCQSIEGSDGLGIDLLDSMIDVPAKIQESEITFLADKSAASTGRRINCRLGVKNGETYRYALRGNSLMLMTPEGTMNMERLSSGEGLSGSWSWKGYIDQGTHVLRTMTIVGGNRVIMRKSCEL